MQRVGGFSTDGRPPWWPVAGVAFAGAVASSAWIATLAHGGAEVHLGLLALPAGLLIAAGVAAVAAIQSRAQAEHARLAEALRETRGRLRCLDEQLDLWQWRTDAQHRLVDLRPPSGPATADWQLPDSGADLFGLFRSDNDAALRSTMHRGAAIDAVEVTGVGDPASRGLLRGRPFHDALGAFAGYHGTVRATVRAEPGLPLAAEPSMPTADAVGAEQESFSYTVSHDLRAPIRVVEGFTKIVKEDYGRLLDRVGNDHLDRVLGAAARMNNMIDALLALSRLATQPLARQPVDLSQLAGYVADDLRRQTPERKVSVSIEPGLRIQGDPTLLRVVLENLVGNAWKYTAKTEHAQIHLERTPNAPHTYTVRDNGAGFDMRFADRLFGVFQRLHSANDFAGTGIGLASVRRIVRRHGGEIWGEAEVNRGARFHFSLPPAAGLPPPAPAPATNPARAPGSGTFRGTIEASATPPSAATPRGAETLVPPRLQPPAAPPSSASSSRSA